MLQENWHVKLNMPNNAKHVAIEAAFVTRHLVIHKLVIICSGSHLSVSSSLLRVYKQSVRLY